MEIWRQEPRMIFEGRTRSGYKWLGLT